MWCCLAGQTAWADDDDPPAPNPATLSVSDPLVYVKADFVTLCVWSETPSDVEIAGNHFTYVTDSEAMDKFARFLYAQFTFDGTIAGMPYGTFRQVAVYSNLVPTSGHSGDIWLPPQNVSSPGTLEYLSNRKPTVFSDGEIRMERIIIEFK
ncbi:MAG: hypothetical protein ACP5RW_08255 [bacterium]